MFFFFLHSLPVDAAPSAHAQCLHMCDIFKHFMKFGMQKKSLISPNKVIRVWMHAQYLLHCGHTCSRCVYCGESALPPVLLDIQILKQTTVRRLHQPPLRHTGPPATRTHMIKKHFLFFSTYLR